MKTNKALEKKILKILDEAAWSSFSIREVTIKLKERFDIKVSPQIVKRYLLKLKTEDRIE